MAKSRMVKTSLWDDDYIGDLEPHGKLVFLNLITNRNSAISGCFPVTIKNIYDDTGVSKDEIRSLLAQFEVDGKIIYRDGWLLLLNFIKHQTLNPNILRGIRQSIKELPEWASSRLVEAYQGLFEGNGESTSSLPSNFKSLILNSNSQEEDFKETEDVDRSLDPLQIEFLEAKALRASICSAQGKKGKVSAITLDEWQTIKEIFDFWRTTVGKDASAKLNVPRGRAVLDRLRPPVPYSVEDIKQAIQGCALNPFNRGLNDRNKPYNDLELICRDDAKLESFMDDYRERKNANGSGNSSSYRSASTNGSAAAEERADAIIERSQHYKRPELSPVAAEN